MDGYRILMLLLNTKRWLLPIASIFIVTYSFSQASFTTSSDTVCLNTPITITNTSVGQANSYWNFCTNNINDPTNTNSACSTNTVNILSSSTRTPPPLIYTIPGTYNICLTINQGLATQNSMCRQVSVQPPTTNLDFNFTQDKCNPLNVTFQNLSSTLNGIKFHWDYGDGTTVTSLPNDLTNINNYSFLGNYTVTLTNTTGCPDTISKIIPVQDTYDKSIVLTHDTTVCKSVPLQLNSMGGYDTYCWKPDAGLSDPNAQNPVAKPLVTTKYGISVTKTGDNLVFNGDFSAGDIGFTSNYQDSTNGHSVYSVGTYTVDTTATIWHPFLARCHDHGGNKMLIANGKDSIGAFVWKQTINNITPNTNYVFSAWVQSMSIANPAQIQLLVNGQAIGKAFTALADTCMWQQPLVTWNAGNNTTATLSIIDLDTINNGNDFALDDISFKSVVVKTDSVTIAISTPTASPTIDTSVCIGQSITLTATSANSYLWVSSNDVVQNESVSPASNTTFTVNRYNILGCFVTDTFNVAVLTDKPSLEFSFSEDLCNPLAISFKNESPKNYTYSWAFGDGVTSTNNNPSIVYPAYGTYNVILENTSGCTNSVEKIITLGLTKDSVIITHDTLLCSAGTLQLATVPALAYCWSPSNGLSNPSSGSPLLTIPATATTYFVNAQVLGTNLIVNWDFSQGNTGFTSEYKYNAKTGYPEGVYWVGTSPQLQPNPWHNLFGFCTDHTTGNGNFMMINGSSNPNTIVWEEKNIAIQPNTNYAFSAWDESLSVGNPSQLQFSINGKPIGNVDTAIMTTCQWKQFYAVWNSGNNTSADISLINLNTAHGGNDFGLDDISFAKYSIVRDSINISVGTTPPVSILNKDTTICVGDSFQVIATGANTYQWTPYKYLSDSSASPIAKPLQTISYTVTGYSAQGCANTATLNVTVNTLPVIAITKDTGVCKGSNIQLSANTPNALTYLWQPKDSFIVINANNIGVSPDSTLAYYVTVTDINHCINKDSVSVAVWQLPTVKTRTDTNICLHDSLLLSTTSTNAVTYQWQPIIGLTDPSAESPTYVASSPNTTQYIVTAFGNHKCTSTDKVNITGLPLPSFTLNPDSFYICRGQSAQLSVTPTTYKSYSWTPTIGLTHTSGATTTASPDSTKTYLVVVSDKQCSDTASAFIYVKQIPVFAINPPAAAICKDSSLLITASGGNKYAWLPPALVQFPDSSANVVNPASTTTYSVNIKDTLCHISDTLSLDLIVNNPPTVTITSSNIINCVQTTDTLTATGASTYSWSPIETLSSITSPITVATPSQTTFYKLKAFSSEHCETDDSILVVVSKYDVGDGYGVPNAFTPTIGSDNQYFRVRWGHVINFEMNIYNRFGQRLFTTNNPDEGWDGRVNGVLQNAGTYVYEIHASTICGEVPRKGTLVLIR